MTIEKLERPERLDEDRIEALNALFPSAVTDGRINFEALRDELEGHTPPRWGQTTSIMACNGRGSVRRRSLRSGHLRERSRQHRARV